MDGYEEKKWFVYMGDHHEGPFSLSDVQVKLSLGSVSAASYVWAEGMGDWKLITEVPEFGPMTAAAAQPLPVTAPPEARVELATPQQAIRSQTPILAPTRSVSVEFTVGARDPNKTAPLLPRKRFGRSWIYFLLIAGLGAAAYTGQLDPLFENPAAKAVGGTVMSALHPTLLQISERFPAVSKWISPIPAIEDVSPAEYKDLKEASTGNLAETGPKVAIAMSTADPTLPVFYVSSNLPDGTMIEIFLEGVGETLLNQLGHSSHHKVVLRKRLGKSEAIRQPDGKPLAKGQYEIYAVDAEQQPDETRSTINALPPLNAKVPATVSKGFHILATRSYFLGGAKDDTYSTRLKEFHDRLKEKTKTELTELRQYAETLQSQLNASLTKFATTRAPAKAKPSPAKKKDWATFHASFSGMATQIKDSFAKLSPEALKTDYFYGMLYERTVNTFKSLETLHETQNSYFTNPPADLSTLEIKLSQLQSEASSSVAALITKIDQAEKLPPSAGGMPSREGL